MFLDLFVQKKIPDHPSMPVGQCIEVEAWVSFRRKFATAQRSGYLAKALTPKHTKRQVRDWPDIPKWQWTCLTGICERGSEIVGRNRVMCSGSPKSRWKIYMKESGKHFVKQGTVKALCNFVQLRWMRWALRVSYSSLTKVVLPCLGCVLPSIVCSNDLKFLLCLTFGVHNVVFNSWEVLVFGSEEVDDTKVRRKVMIYFKALRYLDGKLHRLECTQARGSETLYWCWLLVLIRLNLPTMQSSHFITNSVWGCPFCWGTDLTRIKGGGDRYKDSSKGDPKP